MIICPACEEPLKDDAIVYTHCGQQLAASPAVATSGFTPTPSALKFGCGILILAALALMWWAFSRSMG
jgi:hypothetical protein